MKKVVVLLIMLCCLCSFQVSNAQIEKRIDSFDNTIRIFSVQQNIGQMKGQFNFIKIIAKNEAINYQLYASTEIGKKYSFSNDYAEIKINENIYKIKVLNSEDYNHTDNGLYDISLTVEIPNEIIDDLLASNKVSLRFHRENGWEDIVDLPDEVLNEWKQVIEMEKYYD